MFTSNVGTTHRAASVTTETGELLRVINFPFIKVPDCGGDTRQQFLSVIHEIALEATERAHMYCAFLMNGDTLPEVLRSMREFSAKIDDVDRSRLCQFLNKCRRSTMASLRDDVIGAQDARDQLLILLALNLMSVIIRQNGNAGPKQHWLPVTYLKKWRQSPKARKFTVPYVITENDAVQSGSVSVDDFVHPEPIYSGTVESLFAQFEALYGLYPDSATENLLLAWVQAVRLPVGKNFRGGSTVDVIRCFLEVLNRFPKVYACATEIEPSPLTSTMPRTHISADGKLTASYVMSPEQLLVISTVLPTMETMKMAVDRHYETVVKELQRGVTIYGPVEAL